MHHTGLVTSNEHRLWACSARYSSSSARVLRRAPGGQFHA